ncbi:hypothetical protein L345_18573, partial [Ophiophagus hannah]
MGMRRKERRKERREKMGGRRWE